jgi:hypothetical protein
MGRTDCKPIWALPESVQDDLELIAAAINHDEALRGAAQRQETVLVVRLIETGQSVKERPLAG